MARGLRLAAILCVDLGSTNCKSALVDLTPAGSASQQSATPSLPFFEMNGYSSFCVFAGKLTRPDQPSPPVGLALAIPFEVDYQRNFVASNWRGGWPDNVRGLEASLEDEVGLPCVVLNDAVAFALGCSPDRPESGPQSRLCLTLGTYFGCALLKSSASVQPVEVDDCLRHHTWPDGRSGSPTAILRFHRQQHPNDERAYSRFVGWLIGALQPRLGRLPVILGGADARSVRLDEVAAGIRETGGGAVEVRVEADYLVALLGAARLWDEVVQRRRPIGEVIAPRA